MANVEVAITTQQKKSNAPWILGLIAFILNIPNVLWATFCASVVAGFGSALAERGETTTEEVNQTSNGFATVIGILAVLGILCFILSFFGKSKGSIATGVMLILGGVVIFLLSLVYASALFGTATGILYLIAGVMSIVNAKRIA